MPFLVAVKALLVLPILLIKGFILAAAKQTNLID